MIQRISFENVALLGEQTILVDTNVFVYKFWEKIEDPYLWKRDYADMYDYLADHDYQLAVDFGIISETVNRAIRIKHGILQPDKSWKAFRNSRKGQEEIQKIYTSIDEGILDKVDVLPRPYTKAEIKSMLVADRLDFMDKAVIKTCKEENCILFTADGDFVNAGINLFTGNPNLLGFEQAQVRRKLARKQADDKPTAVQVP
jgi:predicted nucleic acid-binding protein